jgi:hypothetical protein
MAAGAGDLEFALVEIGVSDFDDAEKDAEKAVAGAGQRDQALAGRAVEQTVPENGISRRSTGGADTVREGYWRGIGKVVEK